MPRAFLRHRLHALLKPNPLHTQVLCDLVCVYNALVRSAVAAPELPPTIRATPADAPAAFANAVQVPPGPGSLSTAHCQPCQRWNSWLVA